MRRLNRRAQRLRQIVDLAQHALEDARQLGLLPSETLAAVLAPFGARCGNRWRCSFLAHFKISVGTALWIERRRLNTGKLCHSQQERTACMLIVL